MALNNLRSLYQAVVLDNANHPHNKHNLSNYTVANEIHNASCGDTIKVFILIKDSYIEDISFTGAGCTISQASASMMTQAVKGKNKKTALKMAKIFSDLAIGEKINSQKLKILGDAQILTSVMQFPARIKCATISWWALAQALLKEREKK